MDIDRNVRRNVNIDIDTHNRYHRPRPGFAAGMAIGTVTGMAIGHRIATLPRGYRTIYVSGSPYAYYGGVYYQTSSAGYVVVAPPAGAVVPILPPGAAVTTVDSVSYYVFEGVFYRPVIVSGVTQFQVVVF